jgi:2-methylcitrate dehydratase PrpD
VEAFYEAKRLDRPVPDTTIAAQFSIPFCIALALLYGKVGLAEMTEANLHNPEVLRLAKKVRITINPEYDRQFPEKTVSKVTLHTSSGSFTTTVEFPKGNPENPLSDAELLEKFRTLSTDVITEDQLATLEEAVDRLPHLPNVRELTQLLTV